MLLKAAIPILTAAGCDTPRLDAALLLAHVLGKDRAWLYAHLTDDISAAQVAQFQTYLNRRQKREPLAYILGQQAFCGLDFCVSPAVLVPRPETELLMELALAKIEQLTSRNRFSPIRVLDIGTGSGCIAVSIAHYAPQTLIVATDISWPALLVAQHNASQHQALKRIQFNQMDLLRGFRRPVEIIIANPPYIAQAELATLQPEVQVYEPHLALTDLGDGLSLIKQIIKQAQTILSPDGYLFMEIGATQGDLVLSLVKNLWPTAIATIKPDLAGRDRVLSLQHLSA